ncbi:MAG: tetratricopeptide repeat protein, partial [Coriobacteriales bacterium]|nr:tetratricopeptide repeat protein [Coriobacteriales bacterium]
MSEVQATSAAARAHQASGEFPQALECVERLREIDSFPADGQPRLYELWEARLQQAMGRSDVASERVDSALIRASNLAFEVDASTAWGWLDELSGSFGSDWRCEYLRGMLAALDDANEYALELMDAALEHYTPTGWMPSETLLLQNAAWVARREWRWDRSAAYLEKALAIDPGDPGTLLALGTSYANRGRSAEAVRVLERALATSPHNQDVHLTLARAHRDARDFPKAADHIERARLLAEPEGGGTGS